ncbi:MAG: metallophosphatase [Deltaproteobacteria bacterium]|nr:metallophosphatase [Deltaproteobacteria bacterium]
MSEKRLGAFCAFLLLFLAFFLTPVDLLPRDQADIRILHVNDFHGYAEPFRPFGSIMQEGGIAHLASRVKQLRREKPSLLMAAGDMIHGDDWANRFQGASVFEVMNAMGFDVMVAGNHEFDFGPAVLKQRIGEANFPVLGANVQGVPGLKPFVIKEVGGIKIGIIGVVTPEIVEYDQPEKIAGITFAPAAATVSKFLTALKPQVDLMIVLSHLGYKADRKLAEAVPGIDVIVGGHSHTKLPEPVRIGGTIIVHGYEYARMLGVLDLTVKDGKATAYSGRLEAVDPGSLPADPLILQIVKKYQN